MKTNVLALTLILAAALWRVLVVYHPALFNFAPVTALAFCGAAYLRDRRAWVVPVAALGLSDLWLNHYHATEFCYMWTAGEWMLRSGAIAAATGIGLLVARRRNPLTVVSGVLGSSLVFYVATNSASWFTDAYYAKTAAGWWQALTVGHPEFPPTLWFFRNTLVGDLLFAAVFALAIRATDQTARTTAAAVSQLRPCMTLK